jgi:hypothetical protein
MNPVRLSDAEFEKLSVAERAVYCLQFDQRQFNPSAPAIPERDREVYVQRFTER